MFDSPRASRAPSICRAGLGLLGAFGTAASLALGSVPAGALSDGPDGTLEGGAGEVVADALETPGGLDSPSEVRALAAATAGEPGVPVGVVLDSNGAAPGGLAVERITAEAGQVPELTDRLENIHTVVSAEVDRIVVANADPLAAQQYGLSRMRATASALPAGADGSGVTVAIVDTGVMATHPDLAPPLPDGRPRVLSGTSFLQGDPQNGRPGNVDPNGHGTHVAGIVGAARGNAFGGAGVAPGTQLLPVRTLNASGLGWSSDLAASIRWAHQQGADVINLSLGGAGSTPADVSAAISYVTTDRSRGKAPSVLVAAAGNSGPTGGPSWPGRHPSALAVGATDQADGLASFSTRQPYVALSAPGVSILSTCNDGGYCFMSGTSMATPMAAGAAAVLRQARPQDGPTEVRNRLSASAVDLGPPGHDDGYGAGRIDLAAALAAPSGGGATVPPPPSPPPPLPPPAAPVPVSGTIDLVSVDRRRWQMSGSVVDPDGAPVVRILDVVAGRWELFEVGTTAGRWTASRDGSPAGVHQLCAVAVDHPTGSGVLLGCRQVTIK